MAASDRDEGNAQAAWHRHYEEAARTRDKLVIGRRTGSLHRRRVRLFRLMLTAVALALIAGALTLALTP
jgi:hypothetical protein